MLKRLRKHLKKYKSSYFMGMAIFIVLVGLGSYQPHQAFYSEDGNWLKASALESQKESPYTQSDFVLGVVGRMQKSTCYQDLCADMKGGTPAEKARCNLEKREVYDSKASYKWYSETPTRAEALKVIVKAFGVKMADKVKIPYRDVDAKSWYAPFVKAAYNAKLIKRGTGLLKPDTAVTKIWLSPILSRTKLDRLCDLTPSI